MLMVTDRSAGKMRDGRLDFFRGLGMFIILVAHVPWNPWALWMPGRFGFSDAAEIFVFCSGMVSAMAFAPIFGHGGWLLGAARICHRVWQVYWAHIAVFFVIAACMAAADILLGAGDAFKTGLNLVPFFRDPAGTLVGLFTLTYVPNYFDILPMYLVLLALIPVVMAVAALGRSAVLVLVIGLWLAAHFGLVAFPAEPWSGRRWFFNPLAWQLVFFTGFAFAAGWLPAPPCNRVLLGLAVAVVALTVPLAWHEALNALPALKEWRAAIVPLTAKTRLGLLRYGHFLALAYIAYYVVGAGDGLRGRVAGIICMVGRQTLAVFLTGLVAARLIGVYLDVVGRDAFAVALGNIAGCALLIVVAYGVGWFQSAPWRRARAYEARFATS